MGAKRLYGDLVGEQPLLPHPPEQPAELVVDLGHHPVVGGPQLAAVALVVALGGLALSAIVSPNRRNRVKTANYECGIDPTPANTEHGRFPVSFYLVGMTFIIFDVEVVFLYPWATAFGRLGFFGLGAAVLFIGLITVPYILEWRRGGLDWD